MFVLFFFFNERGLRRPIGRRVKRQIMCMQKNILCVNAGTLCRWSEPDSERDPACVRAAVEEVN